MEQLVPISNRLTCSPFLLNGTISAHLEQINGYLNLKEFTCKFICDLYIDGSSSSFDDIEDAYSFDDIEDAYSFHK